MNTKGSISKKFLNICFMKIIKNESSGDIIVSNIEEKMDLVKKSVVCFRGPVATAMNHCIGFHTQLKLFVKEHKGFENNLLKLIDKNKKRFIKYASGESANELAKRVKTDFLNLRDKLCIETVQICDCESTIHKKLMIDPEIPCM